MTANEKREIFQQVALMDATWIFIMGWLLWLLGWYLSNVEIMKWWIIIMIGVAICIATLYYFKHESEKGLEVMNSYRFSVEK